MKKKQLETQDMDHTARRILNIYIDPVAESSLDQVVKKNYQSFHVFTRKMTLL